jgi:hypothetical protein
MVKFVWEIRFGINPARTVTLAEKHIVYIIEETLDGALNKLAELKRDRSLVVAVERKQEVNA